MKKTFIPSLKNGQIPYTKNQTEFDKLAQSNAFEPFNPHLVEIEQHKHRWLADYFFQKITDLEMNFSQELAQHLIEVKKILQEQGQDPQFCVLSQETKDTRTSVAPTSAPTPAQGGISATKIGKIDLGDFKPHSRLLNLLSQGELSNIRTELMSTLNNRRLSLEEVAKSIWYVWENKPDVFVAEENSVFVQDIDRNEAHWNNDYFNLQQVYLNRNFSFERLLHLVNVRETLMKRGDKAFQQIKMERTTTSAQTSATQQPRVQPTAEHRSSPRHQPQKDEPSIYSSKEENGISKLLLVGGAVLALFAALFAILK